GLADAATVGAVYDRAYFVDSRKRRGHRPRLQGPLGSLAVERIARHVGVPVNERAGWVLLPGPDMQSVKGGKSEAIGTLEEMKELSHQLRRTRVCCIPSIREH